MNFHVASRHPRFLRGSLLHRRRTNLAALLAIRGRAPLTVSPRPDRRQHIPFGSEAAGGTADQITVCRRMSRSLHQAGRKSGANVDSVTLPYSARCAVVADTLSIAASARVARRMLSRALLPTSPATHFSASRPCSSGLSARLTPADLDRLDNYWLFSPA